MPARTMLRTPALILALALGTSFCVGPTAPNRLDSWVARLPDSEIFLFINFAERDSTLNGDGRLALLTDPGRGETLTLAGTRRADTLDIALGRRDGGSLRLVAWYVQDGSGLVGLLSGGEFAEMQLTFRRD